jgi:hypothetical protein
VSRAADDSPDDDRLLPLGERSRLLRIVAAMLAAMAMAWAVFGTIAMIEDGTWHRGPWRTNLLVFGSSYLIAGVLTWRAFGRPSLNWCRAIWALSSLVQGSWLLLILIETFFGRGGGGGLPGLLLMIGFAGSTCVSLVGLVLEPRPPAAV